jgi:hypothetical protein
MKSNNILFTTLALVILLAAAVLDYINPSKQLSLLLWIVTFAALSALFFFAYFVNGLQAWTWLYPACIFAALSEIAFVISLDIINDVWALVFGVASLAIPSLVGYFFDRPRRANLSVASPVSV